MADEKIYYVRDLYTANGSEEFVYVTDIFKGRICISRRYIMRVEPVKVVEIKENDLKSVNSYKKEYEKFIRYTFYEIPAHANTELNLSNHNFAAEDDNGNYVKSFRTIVDKKYAKA